MRATTELEELLAAGASAVVSFELASVFLRFLSSTNSLSDLMTGFATVVAIVFATGSATVWCSTTASALTASRAGIGGGSTYG